MSTEREVKCVMGYNLSNDDVLSIIRKAGYYDEETLTEWEGYHAMLGEMLSDCIDTDLKVTSLYFEGYKKSNIIGIEIKTDLTFDQLMKAVGDAKTVMEEFVTGFGEPIYYSEIYSY